MDTLVVLLVILTIVVCLLVCLVVWRDRRELKFNELENKLARIEEFFTEADKLRNDMENILVNSKKQMEKVFFQVEGQVKQVKNSVTTLEQKMHGEKFEDKRVKEKNNNTRSKERRDVRSSKQKTQKVNQIGKETEKIDDGRRYNKLYELANQGLNSHEIARRLNMGHDEVELVLELKGRRLS